MGGGGGMGAQGGRGQVVACGVGDPFLSSLRLQRLDCGASVAKGGVLVAPTRALSSRP